MQHANQPFWILNSKFWICYSGRFTQYNPELLDKERLLAITKCDMLDEELIEQMKSELPEDIETIFISSVAGLNIQQLKDKIWAALQR